MCSRRTYLFKALIFVSLSASADTVPLDDALRSFSSRWDSRFLPSGLISIDRSVERWKETQTRKQSRDIVRLDFSLAARLHCYWYHSRRYQEAKLTIQTNIHTDTQTQAERQTDRQTDRHTGRQTYGQTARQTDRQTPRHIHTHAYIHTHIHIHIYTYIYTHIYTHIYTDTYTHADSTDR